MHWIVSTSDEMWVADESEIGALIHDQLALGEVVEFARVAPIETSS